MKFQEGSLVKLVGISINHKAPGTHFIDKTIIKLGIQ